MQILRNRKTLLALAALLLLSVVTFAARAYFSASQPTSYITARVGRSDLENAVMATGTLQAFQQVDVGAQVSGQLKSLKVQLGEHVTKGQWLAEIDPELSLNSLRSAKANLQSLEAQRRAVAATLWQAELANRRQQEMIAKDATSRQELDAAKAQMQVITANLASFDAQISQAKAQLDSAQTSLAYTKINAPIDGDVVAVVTQEGQTVVAIQQAPVILRLANLGTMTVKAQISEADVIRIQPGQKAYFTILGDSDERYVGTLRAIEPGPQDFSNGTNGSPKANGPIFYNALFEAPNPNHRLRIGMTAQVTVVLAEAKGALTIPIAALGTRDESGLYPVRVRDGNGAITTKMVKTGINNSVNVEVIEGLAEADEVITAELAGK